jgi:hypothetical protein
MAFTLSWFHLKQKIVFYPSTLLLPLSSLSPDKSYTHLAIRERSYDHEDCLSPFSLNKAKSTIIKWKAL